MSFIYRWIETYFHMIIWKVSHAFSLTLKQRLNFNVCRLCAGSFRERQSRHIRPEFQSFREHLVLCWAGQISSVLDVVSQSRLAPLAVSAIPLHARFWSRTNIRHSTTRGFHLLDGQCIQFASHRQTSKALEFFDGGRHVMVSCASRWQVLVLAQEILPKESRCI